MSSPPVELGIPDDYLPPEVMKDEQSIRVACDLWALGCTLFEIRRQMQLFYMINGKDELLTEMTSFLDSCQRNGGINKSGDLTSSTRMVREFE
jgi:serine/threonine protein kinase